MLRVDRLERLVLGLEPDAVGLAEEALAGRLVGRLVVAGERDDDVAVPRVLLPAHDDVVAVEDARVDHRVALDAQEELLAAARERLGDGDIEAFRPRRRLHCHRNYFPIGSHVE